MILWLLIFLSISHVWNDTNENQNHLNVFRQLGLRPRSGTLEVSWENMSNWYEVTHLDNVIHDSELSDLEVTWWIALVRRAMDSLDWSIWIFWYPRMRTMLWVFKAQVLLYAYALKVRLDVLCNMFLGWIMGPSWLEYVSIQSMTDIGQVSYIIRSTHSGYVDFWFYSLRMVPPARVVSSRGLWNGMGESWRGY